jgi:hypothetical protein
MPTNNSGVPAPQTRARSNTLLFAAFFLSFYLIIPIVLRTQPFNDPGAFWHIRVGDWIIDHRAFPHTDPFTWSYVDRPWIPQQWGAEVVMSLVHRSGGFDALLLGMSALLALMAARISLRFVDAGLHWMPAAAIVALGMAAAGFHFYLRPHLTSIVLLAVVMFRLVDLDRGRIGVKGLLWLIPLCAAWTNLHGGVLGGIFTFGIAIGGWALFRTQPRQQIGWLSLILLACLLSTLVNPFGLGMHRTWWSIIGSKVLRVYVSEHQPLSLMHTDGQAIVGFGCFYLLMLFATLPKAPRVTWLLPLFWLGLSFSSIRHGPLFCATALVALADLMPETVWFRLLKKYGDTFAREPSAVPSSLGWRCWAISVAAIALTLLLQVSRIPVPVIGHGWARFDLKMVPDDMRETLQDYARTRPDGFPIFNDANLGGYLIFFTPSLKVFMDDRCELYGDEGMTDYVDLANDHPERINEWAAKAPFDRALVQCDTEREPAAMDRYLRTSERWKEVMRGQKAVLYERVK